MVSCCAYGCTKKFVKNSSISFHKLPTNPEMREKWIKAVRSENFILSNNAVVCSEHFSSADFINLSNRRRTLTKDAVPTIFNYPEHSVKESLSRRSIRNTPYQEDAEIFASTSNETHNDNTERFADEQMSCNNICLSSIVIEDTDDEVEWIEDNSENESPIDYIVLDDDDNDDSSSPNDEQLQFVTNPELQMKCEIGEVSIKDESLYSGTESISSDGNQAETGSGSDKHINVTVQTLAGVEAKETAMDDVDASTPKEEKGNGKNFASLAMTLGEKELGDLLEAVKSKSGSNESQSIANSKGPFADMKGNYLDLKMTKRVDKSEVDEAESIPATITSSEDDTKRLDLLTFLKTESTDTPLIKTENNQNVEANTIESRSKSRAVWVSNLKRSTKASDLKQHLNKFGKVITTKIVTDGRRSFGYAVLESYKDTENCIKNLNDSEFEGGRIVIATTKPNVENKNKPTMEDEELKSNEDKNNKKRTYSTEGKERKSKTVLKFTKRHRSPSMVPMTTKFNDKHLSRIKESRMEREYLREKQEKERLKRRLAEEMKRSRDEMNRLREKVEEQRLMELELELERKKRLRLEKEILERFVHSEKDQRMPWNSTISSQWKTNSMESQSGSGFPVNRYSEFNYNSANCNTSGFPQPTPYNPQPNNVPPPAPEINYNCNSWGYSQPSFYNSQSNNLPAPVNRYPEMNYNGTNYNSLGFSQPAYYNPQHQPAPDYKYFDHHSSNRKY
ncbi:SAFB-like transcription modulator isoform X2 [Agrilus planipennis]|uniref:SAFB-like transcription modulator isoform X2 n=1 Tax=Agrilus planipennis TaxID=224129 RepID=A0A1W4WP14_AGRPL|nr:SAFB-like transcription modulator isoform X2 [Agrilus planipennis]